MRIEMLQSKIHRATVTDANLNYNGSITVDKALLKAAGIAEFQKVDVVNIANGERISTYTIAGKKGEICLNGAAARKFCVGDLVIIMAYCTLEKSEISEHEPKVIIVDAQNKPIKG